MALDFEVDSIDGLDEGVKGFYVEHEGKYRLDVSGIDPADELKQALIKERNDHKNAKSKLHEMETAQQEAARLAQEKLDQAAKENGDFKSLYESLQKKFDDLNQTHTGLQKSISDEKVNSTALKIATELADGDNAALLSTFISQRLRFEDGKIKVTNDSGELVANSLDELKSEFQNNSRFAALLKGNQSSGGGANGGKNGSGAVTKEMTRAEFEKLTPGDAAKFFKDGGKVISN